MGKNPTSEGREGEDTSDKQKDCGEERPDRRKKSSFLGRPEKEKSLRKRGSE